MLPSPLRPVGTTLLFCRLPVPLDALDTREPTLNSRCTLSLAFALSLKTDALIAAGVPCAKLDSTLEAHEVYDIYDQVTYGQQGHRRDVDLLRNMGFQDSAVRGQGKMAAPLRDPVLVGVWDVWRFLSYRLGTWRRAVAMLLRLFYW